MKKSEIISIIEQIKDVNEKSSNSSVFVNTSNPVVKELCEELNIMMEFNRSLESNYIKSENNYKQMLSNISHDLKTPLTVIMGLLEMLNFENKTLEENSRLAKKTYTVAEELHNIINEFFELAKLESMDSEISLSQVNLSEIAKKIILNFYDLIESNNINLKLNIPEHTVNIMGNEKSIKRILRNLLQNAIQYGGNTIGIDIIESEVYVSLTVYDNGQGIEKQDINKIFNRLFTLEDSRNKKFQGSGLGLTIVKQLVEQMNGEITVSSVAFERTEFKILFKKFIY